MNFRLEDTDSIESAKCTFIETMEKSDNKNLPSSKLQPLLKLMEKAAKGVRKIAALFNKRKKSRKNPIQISKSRVHQILAKAGLTGTKKVPEPPKHLHRPGEPLPQAGALDPLRPGGQKTPSRAHDDQIEGEDHVSRPQRRLVGIPGLGDGRADAVLRNRVGRQPELRREAGGAARGLGSPPHSPGAASGASWRCR